MKPIVVYVSKDARGQELITMTKQQFDAIVDQCYDAGVIDGRKGSVGGIGYGYGDIAPLNNETILDIKDTLERENVTVCSGYKEASAQC